MSTTDSFGAGQADPGWGDQSGAAIAQGEPGSSDGSAGKAANPLARFMDRQLHEYPDDKKRYLYLGVTVLATIILYYELYIPGAVATSLITSLGMSFTQFIWVSIIGNLIGAFASLAAGLADRWGRANLVVIGLFVTGVLTAVALPLSSNAVTYTIFFALLSLVEGMILVATPALIRDFSPQVGRGTAMGFWTLGPVLGSLVVTVVSSSTLDSHPNWEFHFVVCGIVGIIVAIIAFFTLRELSPQLRDQLMVTMRDRALIEARAKNIDVSEQTGNPWKQMLTLNIVGPAFAISIFLLFYYVAVGFFVVYFATVFGMSPADANSLANYYWIFNALSLVLTGYLTDKLGVRKPFMVIGAVISMIGVAIWAVKATDPTTTVTTFAVLMVIISVGGGICYTAWMAAFTETVEDRNPAATATGLAVWGWIIRIVVTISLLIFSFALPATRVLVEDGAQAAAISEQYGRQLAVANALTATTTTALARNPDDANARAKAVTEIRVSGVAESATDALAELEYYLHNKIPNDALVFLSQSGDKIAQAAEESPGQWQRWWWITFAGQLLFLPFIFLMRGRWSPRKALEDADEHERLVAAEMEKLNLPYDGAGSTAAVSAGAAAVASSGAVAAGSVGTEPVDSGLADLGLADSQSVDAGSVAGSAGAESAGAWSALADPSASDYSASLVDSVGSAESAPVESPESTAWAAPEPVQEPAAPAVTPGLLPADPSLSAWLRKPVDTEPPAASAETEDAGEPSAQLESDNASSATSWTEPDAEQVTEPEPVADQWVDPAADEWVDPAADIAPLGAPPVESSWAEPEAEFAEPEVAEADPSWDEVVDEPAAEPALAATGWDEPAVDAPADADRAEDTVEEADDVALDADLAGDAVDAVDGGPVESTPDDADAAFAVNADDDVFVADEAAGGDDAALIEDDVAAIDDETVYDEAVYDESILTDESAADDAAAVDDEMATEEATATEGVDATTEAAAAEDPVAGDADYALWSEEELAGETVPEPATESEVGADAESSLDAEPETDADSVVDLEVEAEPAAAAEVDPELDVEPEAELESEAPAAEADPWDVAEAPGGKRVSVADMLAKIDRDEPAGDTAESIEPWESPSDSALWDDATEPASVDELAEVEIPAVNLDAVDIPAVDTAVAEAPAAAEVADVEVPEVEEVADVEVPEIEEVADVEVPVVEEVGAVDTPVTELSEASDIAPETEPSVVDSSDASIAAEPVTEELVAEESVTAESAIEESVAEDSVSEEPAFDEAVTDEPVAEESAAEALVPEDSVTEEPAIEVPVTEDPAADEVVAEDAAQDHDVVNVVESNRGLPPVPGALPPVPSDLPPVPSGLPPVPSELPPVPSDLPPVPLEEAEPVADEAPVPTPPKKRAPRKTAPSKSAPAKSAPAKSAPAKKARPKPAQPKRRAAPPRGLPPVPPEWGTDEPPKPRRGRHARPDDD